MWRPCGKKCCSRRPKSAAMPVAILAALLLLRLGPTGAEKGVLLQDLYDNSTKYKGRFAAPGALLEDPNLPNYWNCPNTNRGPAPVRSASRDAFIFYCFVLDWSVLGALLLLGRYGTALRRRFPTVNTAQTEPLQFCNYFNDLACCTPQVDEEVLQNFLLMYSVLARLHGHGDACSAGADVPRAGRDALLAHGRHLLPAMQPFHPQRWPMLLHPRPTRCSSCGMSCTTPCARAAPPPARMRSRSSSARTGPNPPSSTMRRSTCLTSAASATPPLVSAPSLSCCQVCAA